MRIPRIVIAGTHSGSGKTSVTVAMLRALQRRGLQVQPFKAGPDFIDPSLHTAAAGRASRNLDSWLLPRPTVTELFARAAEGSDLAVVEGVMGLFDGYRGGGEEGSTAEVAKWLGAPVVLVVDAAGAVRSVAAIAMGFTAFDPDLTIAGVIVTRVGSGRHLTWLQEALEAAGIPLLGMLPWDSRLQLPERHLGLVPAEEQSAERTIAALADAAEAHLDLDAILRAAKQSPPLVVPGPLVFPLMPIQAGIRIGVARDAAFTFYYQDALDLLESRGAKIVPFSPIGDRAIPDVQGLYLGGGFPEAHAERLSANRWMRDSIRRAINAGMPVYAECGGLMYLCRDLIDQAGTRHEMVGTLAATATMQPQLMALGYVTLEAEDDTLLLRRGESARGHEFHFSTIHFDEPEPLAFRSHEGRGLRDGRDGISRANLLASYTHLHFAGTPVLAERFVEACRRYQETVNRE
ncbi:MAG: cobyrinate a,c-diamide synthase [Armatimonadetes bacterium]|nr:cobyrinate a,c-diamide synthase [Armatimonadota bacterium]